MKKLVVKTNDFEVLCRASKGINPISAGVFLFVLSVWFSNFSPAQSQTVDETVRWLKSHVEGDGVAWVGDHAHYDVSKFSADCSYIRFRFGVGNTYSEWADAEIPLRTIDLSDGLMCQKHTFCVHVSGPSGADDWSGVFLDSHSHDGPSEEWMSSRIFKALRHLQDVCGGFVKINDGPF